GLAKYKHTKELTQTIKFKYFFPINQLLQTFANKDLVFISDKFIVENSEPCFTIAYSSIVDNENPNCEFDLSNVPITIPYKTIQYNSVTGNSDIKMNMTIIYSLNSSRFKYLDHLHSNSGKMMIEATNIDYLKTSSINISRSESSRSTISDALLIIDIIDDDIDSTITKAPQDHKEYYTTNANIEAIVFYDSKKYHTIIEDYKSDEKQFDYENGNESDDENAIGITT
ncbi:4049_t:CDS:2, partial [Dentiscutata heterogama]